MRFVTFGEKVTPAKRDITGENVSRDPVGPVQLFKATHGLRTDRTFL